MSADRNVELVYVIRFVADMAGETRFYRDVLGLSLRFESPGWTEFNTGATTLALHPASAEHPAGGCQTGFRVGDLDAFHSLMSAEGRVCTRPPEREHGVRMARYRDPDGAEFSVSERPL